METQSLMLLLQVPDDQHEERRTFPMQLSLLKMGGSKPSEKHV